MGARELRDSINDTYEGNLTDEYDERGRRLRETLPQIWNRKLEESKVEGDPHSFDGPHGAGVYKSMEEHGYDWSKPPIPILLVRPMFDKPARVILDDGYHRVAAAADIEEKTGRHIPIPIEYTDQ